MKNCYKFERFQNLYTVDNWSHNNESEEIERRVQIAKKCYYGFRKYFKSRLLDWKTKYNIVSIKND